jgi:hypothetical protein
VRADGPGPGRTCEPAPRLVVKLRHHGDVLLASPVFSVLKNLEPQLEIDAVLYDDTQEMRPCTRRSPRCT